MTKYVLLAYLVIINIVAVFRIKDDKLKAKNDGFRTPERSFFLTAILGGSIGTIAGMYIFKHKTKKPLFFLGMPLILILQIALGVYYYLHYVKGMV